MGAYAGTRIVANTLALIGVLLVGFGILSGFKIASGGSSYGMLDASIIGLQYGGAASAFVAGMLFLGFSRGLDVLTDIAINTESLNTVVEANKRTSAFFDQVAERQRRAES